MALIQCIDCGKYISTLAVFCPNCGRPNEQNKEPFYPELSGEILKRIALGHRIVCSDDICVGIINESGFCGTCGKHFSWNKEEASKKGHPDKAESKLSCPECGSTQITAQKKGFSSGDAAITGVIFGPLAGFVGGHIGADQIQLTCLACGHLWNPPKK